MTPKILVVDDDAALAEWLADESCGKALHEAKGPMLACWSRGWDLRGVTADTVLAAFLSVCDGSMSARTALVAIASLVGVPDDEVIAGTLPLLRRLIANGMLERVQG